MRRFRFPLETLLRMRREKEEERKRRLADAQRAVLEQKDRLTELFREDMIEAEAQRRLRQGPVDMPQVRAHLAYSRAVVRRIKDGFNDLQDRVSTEGVRRVELLRAAQERRALERLRERKVEAWKHEAGREEQKTLDEIANARATPRRA